MLLTMKSAQCFLDSGYTMAFGAASAKKRLDVVIRDAINAGDIPGPRYLANGQEMCRRDGDLVAGISAFADGPDEMREVIREHIELGVDNIKLSMSGEEASSSIPSPKLAALIDLIARSRSRRSGLHKTATSQMRRRQPVWMRPIKPVNGSVHTLAHATQ